MRFIGRQTELNKLHAEYNRDSSFVVIYGCRRVGKTTLIKEFLKKKTAFVAFAYEDICKDIFANMCKNETIPFDLSRIGSYWLNDFDGNTEIDVMAIDHRNKRIFAGESKYHAKPVDAPVYFALKEKLVNAAEIRKAFPGYDVIFGVFSKSGFTQRMLDAAKENTALLLINEDHLA